MTDPNTEAVATAICQALGLNPYEPATSPAPGLPGLRWTQFVTAAEAARGKAEPIVAHQVSVYDPAAPVAAPDGYVRVSYMGPPVTYGATTSEEVASIAAKGLTNPKSLTEDEIQSVCASALVQR